MYFKALNRRIRAKDPAKSEASGSAADAAVVIERIETEFAGHAVPDLFRIAFRDLPDVVRIGQLRMAEDDHVCGAFSRMFSISSGSRMPMAAKTGTLTAMHQTPFDFLLHYRIQKSLPLLCSTDQSVTEIAGCVGFSGSSYYSEVFRKFMQCSPTEYRRNNAAQPQA